ncbi:MAG: hypothetical protein IK026_05220 [Eubacteriaceae bacterium]|nr:hypothetical protein [Eubacteriaceae bacterium]
MALFELNFNSQYLGGNTEISVIMPDKGWGQDAAEFYASGKKYKVLWLLHGAFGDSTDWVRKSNIEIYATEKNLIVVMPSALNSGYSNDTTLRYNMWDFLIKELMPLVYNWLPASDKREDNYIAGLSMGGFGTAKYAVNYPEKFAAAAVLSGPPSNYRKVLEDQEKNGDGAGNLMLVNAMKNFGSKEEFLDSYENTWERLAEKAGTGKLPRFYFACGKKDFLYQSFTEFRKYAEQIGLDAEFEEIEGYGHEWRFWDLTIQHALDFFGIPDAPGPQM